MTVPKLKVLWRRQQRNTHNSEPRQKEEVHKTGSHWVQEAQLPGSCEKCPLANKAVVGELQGTLGFSL